MGGFDCVFVGFVNDDYVGVLVDDQQDFVDQCEDGGDDIEGEGLGQVIVVLVYYKYQNFQDDQVCCK